MNSMFTTPQICSFSPIYFTIHSNFALWNILTVVPAPFLVRSNSSRGTQNDLPVIGSLTKSTVHILPSIFSWKIYEEIWDHWKKCVDIVVQ